MVIMVVIVAFIAVVLFGTLGNSKVRTGPVYMAGITVDSTKRVFRGSLRDSPRQRLAIGISKAFSEKHASIRPRPC